MGGILAAGPTFTADDPPSVNGCSMKTEANLAAVKAIPPGKIMFETGQLVPGLGRYPHFNLLSIYGRCPLVFDDYQPRITIPH